RLIRETLGEAYDRDRLAQIRAAQEQMLEKQEALEKVLDRRELAPRDYAKASNENNRYFLDAVAAILGKQDYETVFGAPPSRRVDLIDPDEAEKSVRPAEDY